MLLFGAAISERLRAIRAREEILAVVSHDLKNPLSSIRLSAAQLLKYLPEEGRGAKARNSVRVVERIGASSWSTSSASARSGDPRHRAPHAGMRGRRARHDRARGGRDDPILGRGRLQLCG